MAEIKNHLAWVDVEDQVAGGNRALATARTNRRKDWAIIESPEITPFKGLDLKPMYSYFHADGLTAGAAPRQASKPPTGGAALNDATPSGGGRPAPPAGEFANTYTV